MKKLIAVLLIVMLTLGALAVGSYADDASTTYKSQDIVRIKDTEEGDVTILQPGDTVKFKNKSKRLTVTYKPDAINITGAGEVTNLKWKAYIESLGKDVTLAESASKYKSFVYSFESEESVELEATVASLNSADYESEGISAYDITGYDWGIKPIDFALKDSAGNDVEFLGWAVGALSNSGSGTTLELYAYWTRDASSTEEEVETVPEAGRPERKSDIIVFMEWIFSMFDSSKNPYDTSNWKYYITFVPILVTTAANAVGKLLSDGYLSGVLYKFFKINVD
ncbi:MAG: hypothetical protein K6F09_04520 [Clostridiales bacterium]|nr:hypothetical protein [Clostridiales bacterium]